MKIKLTNETLIKIVIIITVICLLKISFHGITLNLNGDINLDHEGYLDTTVDVKNDILDGNHSFDLWLYD